MEDELERPLKDLLEWYREEAKYDLIQQADNAFDDALVFRYEDKQWFPEVGQMTQTPVSYTHLTLPTIYSV